jgi:hypothetical protein
MAMIDAARRQPALSHPRGVARQAYVYGVWLLLAAIVVQFFLAGLGALDNATFWVWHVTNGSVVGLLPLVLVGVGAFGRVPPRTLWLTAAVFGLVALQSVLIAPYRAAATGWVRAIAGLHVVNGLLVFWVGLKLLERTVHLSRASGREKR